MFVDIIKRGIKIYLVWRRTGIIEIVGGYFLDIMIALITIVVIVIWFVIFVVRDIKDLPIETEDDFNALIISANNTTSLTGVSAFLIILFALRSLRDLTTQFPAFGALFETIRIAKADLRDIMLVICIMGLGWVIVVCLLTGPYIDEGMTFFSSAYKVLKTILGHQTLANYKHPQIPLVITNLVFWCITILLNFILMKYTVTIVIVRYKYLREKLQLENEVKARILKDETLVNYPILFRIDISRKMDQPDIIQKCKKGKKSESESE
jgi:hypothetical protein